MTTGRINQITARTHSSGGRRWATSSDLRCNRVGLTADSTSRPRGSGSERPQYHHHHLSAASFLTVSPNAPPACPRTGGLSYPPGPATGTASSVEAFRCGAASASPTHEHAQILASGHVGATPSHNWHDSWRNRPKKTPLGLPRNQLWSALRSEPSGPFAYFSDAISCHPFATTCPLDIRFQRPISHLPGDTWGGGGNFAKKMCSHGFRRKSARNTRLGPQTPKKAFLVEKQ